MVKHLARIQPVMLHTDLSVRETASPQPGPRMTRIERSSSLGTAWLSSYRRWRSVRQLHKPQWRPHMTLDGFRPVDVYCRDLPEPVARDAKVVPLNIERRYFAETRVTGFRLRDAA